MSTKQQRRLVKLGQKEQEAAELEAKKIADGTADESVTDLDNIDLLEVKDVRTAAETFAENNWKLIVGVIAGILLISAAAFYYTSVYMPAQVKAAASEMFVAQTKFENSEFRAALDGDGSNLGFIELANKYGGKAGNLARYYAGISYLNLGEFDNAITELSKFSSSDIIVSAMAKGALGDAKAEKGDLDAAIADYKSAAATNPNELSSPYYLMKAGIALESQGKAAEALNLYKEIKNKYPESQQGRDADKLIVRAQAKI